MSRDQTELADTFLALLHPIRGEIEIHCRRLIWNEHDAPDALQNAVLRAFKAFDRYHEAGNFRAWMFKIVTNEVFKLNAKHGRLAQFEYQVEPEELNALPVLEQSAAYKDWLNTPEALADALDQELLASLRTLTDTERAVLLLAAIGEFRYREIAEILAVPMGTVMGTYSRARKKMQAAIQRSQQRSVL
jgi:RNA polymerase sigma-70 factor (ECF subfamily)